MHLYSPRIINLDHIEKIIRVEECDLIVFYEDNKLIIPMYIT